MAKVRRARTISYFELVSDRSMARMLPANWQQRLAAVGDWPLAKRTVKGPDGLLIGSVLNAGGGRHVVLASVTDDGEHPFTVDLTSGSIEELQLAAGKGVVETSVVSFLGFGNVVAFVRASRGGPGVSALVAWLNECRVTKKHVAAQAVLSRDLAGKLSRAVGVDVIEVGTGRSNTFAAAGGNGTSRLLREVSEGIGPVRASIRLSIGAKHGVKAEQEAMLAEARRMATDGSLGKAKARLVYVKGDREEREMVDFLSHRITAQARVEVGEDEQTLRLVSAVRAMMVATDDVEEELRAAVDDRGANPKALVTMGEQLAADTAAGTGGRRPERG